MNETLNTLLNRSSLRKYDSIPISEEHLDLILESAMRAPTAGNMMTYSIIVIKDEAMKERLSHTCDEQPFIKTAPVVLIFVADYEKWMKYYQFHGVKEYCESNNRRFVVPSESSLILAIQDAMIAGQNAVIAAESLGIGSCYIGDIMEQVETHRELLHLPKYAFPAGMLCLGYYPAGYVQTNRPRFAKKYVVFNEHYQALTESEISDMYSSLNSRLAIPNRFNAMNYAQFHFAMKTNASFSLEMARSVQETLKIWDGSDYKD